MGKRNISSLHEVELPATKQFCTTLPAQKIKNIDQPKLSSQPISFFGKITTRGLSSEEHQPPSKRPYSRPEDQSTVTSNDKADITGQQFSMDQLLDQWFGLDREKRKSARFTGFHPIPKPIAKSNNNGNINISTILNKPRPKAIERKTTKDFTIFEDDTATETTKPTPDEIKTNPKFYDFGSQDDIASYITYIRRGTKTVIQRASWKYANYVTEWLSPLAVYLDLMTPYSGPGFEARLCSWTSKIESVLEEGIPDPRGARYGRAKHAHVGNEEEWLKVEDVEELAETMDDVYQVVQRYQMSGVLEEGDVPQVKEHCCKTLAMIAGYCLTLGGGMDVGGPIDMGYLDDGRRDPEFFRRLRTAWSRIVELYLDDDLESYWDVTQTWRPVWWIKRLRRRFALYGLNDFINWEVMENFWGDSLPPCENFRKFGGRVNRAKEDPWAEERFEVRLDEWSFE